MKPTILALWLRATYPADPQVGRLHMGLHDYIMARGRFFAFQRKTIVLPAKVQRPQNPNLFDFGVMT